MFKSGGTNPYDEVVAKTTDENLTAENWELILTLCDKVVDEGEQGARNVIAALVKRLAHRNPNVQLYAFSVAEALSKNCGIELHREIASRSFTQALEKLITDRTTHEKVKRRALGLIAMWTADFSDNASLGLIEECYNNLKAKNYKFEQPAEAPPPAVDDELLRKEEEELQRVLEMSMHDKGGRNQWAEYSAASSSGAGGSGSASNLNQPSAARVDAGSRVPPNGKLPGLDTAGASAAAPAAQTPMPISPIFKAASAVQVPSGVMSVPEMPNASDKIITRVRALHSFQPTEPGELQFEKGDVIKVVDRNYKDWWRGQLRGRTGIFPVNYVEPLPEQTPADIAREAEHEAAIFAQAANIDKLLSMLRNLDPTKDSLADNEEIQELYRQSMSLRPKIVKLIDKYNQKKAELVLMNESFVKAKTIFERMMEDSLARHTSEYGGGVPITQQQHPDFNRRVSSYGAWNPAVYDQAVPGYPFGHGGRQPFGPPIEMNAYGPQPAAYGPPHTSQAVQQPYPAESAFIQQQLLPQFPQGPAPQPLQHVQQLPAQALPEPTTQATSQQPPIQQQAQSLQQPSAQAQQPATAIEDGPPYDYSPTAKYADQGAQAWAQYYAQGGTDPAGAVYFKFVPGITDSIPQSDPPRSGSGEMAGHQQGIQHVAGDTQPQTYGQAAWIQQGSPVEPGAQSPTHQHSAPSLSMYGARDPQGGSAPGYPNGYGQEPIAPMQHQLQQQFASMTVHDSNVPRSSSGPGGIPV